MALVTQRVWRSGPRIIGCVVALAMLAPVLAVAECAWVLWVRVNMQYPSGVLQGSASDPISLMVWQPHSGHKSAAECSKAETARDRILATLAGPQGRPHETVATQVRADGTVNMIKVVVTPNLETRCLPDTVDPRGRK